MNIGAAVQALKEGKSVARTGWNGRGMRLQMFDDVHHELPRGLGVAVDFPTEEKWQPFVAMLTVQKSWVPWLCSQTDLIAEDWEIVS